MEHYFGINYEFSKERIFGRIDRTIATDGKGYVCVVDGIVLTETHLSPSYLDIINQSLFSISDSRWVPLFIRAIHHVNVAPYQGPQIFLDMVKMCKYRMYFLGGDQVLLDALRQRLTAYDPAIADMPFRTLPFCGIDDFDYEGIASDINSYAPDIIWVSLGAVKQETFANRLLPHLQRGVMLTVGAVFKYNSGLPHTRRAPEWMVRCHVEFLFRLCQEPRKQSRRVWRYVSTLPAILWQEYRHTCTKPQR